MGRDRERARGWADRLLQSGLQQIEAERAGFAPFGSATTGEPCCMRGLCWKGRCGKLAAPYASLPALGTASALAWGAPEPGEVGCRNALRVAARQITLRQAHRRVGSGRRSRAGLASASRL